jgi:phospholipase/carboxylesterase
MALRPLTGPRLPPARGQATHLVVLCHGYGADGNDLIGLAPHWQRMLPTVAFVAPNAPEPCAGAPMGHQWFPISRLDPGEMAKGVESAALGLNEFLDAELKRLELPGDRLALVGFSQGTMMALHVGLSRAVKPAAVVGYSGMLAGAPPTLGTDAPPVLLVHGDADPMIPVGAIFDAATQLGRAGASVQWHVSSGVGHSIDEAGLMLAGLHLTMAFRGMLKRHSAEISCAVG